MSASLSPLQPISKAKKAIHKTDGLSEGVDGEGNGDIRFNIEFEDDREREMYGLGGGSLGLSKLGDRLDDWSIS